MLCLSEKTTCVARGDLVFCSVNNPTSHVYHDHLMIYHHVSVSQIELRIMYYDFCAYMYKYTCAYKTCAVCNAQVNTHRHIQCLYRRRCRRTTSINIICTIVSPPHHRRSAFRCCPPSELLIQISAGECMFSSFSFFSLSCLFLPFLYT